MQLLRIALAQINPVMGDLRGNADMILSAARQAKEHGASVVLFPELSLCGYPPEDLVLKHHFLEATADTLANLAAELPEELICLVGTPLVSGDKAANAVAVIENGRIVAYYRKQQLPNYGVFDEKRVFESGDEMVCLHVHGLRLGIHVCEDSWIPATPTMENLRNLQIDALLNLSASPFHQGKLSDREDALRHSARVLQTTLVYCNLVGGQDELVFDGGSMVITPEGEICARAKRFEEDLLLYDLPITERALLDAGGTENTTQVVLQGGKAIEESVCAPPRLESRGESLEEIYHALVLGLRDYTNKNGFQDVLVAVSGGIDSALVAALAVDALGKDRVTGVSLPTRFSSQETRSDAEELAANLGFDMPMVPIQDLFESFLGVLHPLWPGREPDVTEENLQARIRGTLVMALSNKFNRLVLATGNKSELATGYCTLYGDMCGGFAVIKDVPKTTVFALCEWINEQAGRERIPASTIHRPPSAELREDQKDSDSLPPYEELDEILHRYVELDQGLKQIIAAGLPEETVQRVIHLVEINEYKRRQGAPGVKITPKAFSRDRRMPITNRFRHHKFDTITTPIGDTYE